MRKILIAGGLTAAAVAAVIGVASTNQLTGVSTHGAQTVGYGTATISGATVDSIKYNVDPAVDDQLDSVVISFASNLKGQAVQVAFGTDNLAGCQSSGPTATDTDGVVDPAATGNTVVTCDFGTNQPVTTATKLRVAVTSAPNGN
jgi:hypothetical protein